MKFIQIFLCKNVTCFAINQLNITTYIQIIYVLQRVKVYNKSGIFYAKNIFEFHIYGA